MTMFLSLVMARSILSLGFILIVIIVLLCVVFVVNVSDKL